MPVDLRALIEPSSTAVLTMELQRGVTGDLSAMPELAAEVKAAGLLDNVAQLCAAARGVGARVVHCTAKYLPDAAGYKVNSRIQGAAVKMNKDRLAVGSPGADVMPEIGPEPSDIEVARVHGMTPFTSTPLDQILRNLGVTTIIGTGNSVNIGVVGMVISAIDLGYQVVVPRDAVAGVPKEYADAVLDNTIAMLATVCTTDDIVQAWA